MTGPGAANTKIGDTLISADSADWGTVTANQYQYNYFNCVDTSGVTRNYFILSNLANVLGIVTFTLLDPIPTALPASPTSATVTIKPTPGLIRLDTTRVPGFTGVVRKVEYDDGDGYEELDYKNKEDMDLLYGNDRDTTGEVDFYWFTKLSGVYYLNLYRVPDESGTIRIIYPRTIETMDTDGAASTIDLVYHPAILTYAKGLISDDRKDTVRANREYSRYEAQMERMTIMNEREDRSEPRTIQYADDDYGYGWW